MESEDIKGLVEHVKSKTDLRAVFDYLEIPVSKGGKVSCWSHGTDSNPSVHLYEDSYYCFGCHNTGDVVNLLRDVEGYTFFGALEFLNKQYSLGMNFDSMLDDKTKEDLRLKRLLQRMAESCNEALLNKPSLEDERKFVRSKGMHGDDVKTWIIGYCDVYDMHVELGCTPDDLIAAGVYGTKDDGTGHYNIFFQRLLFPICDASGKVVSFGGRSLDPDAPAKYKNGPSTRLYDKSRILYGLHKARKAMRKSKTVVVVEGYTDVIRRHQQGNENVVASCGTAFTDSHYDSVSSIADRVVLMYDGDKAGWLSMQKTIEAQSDNVAGISVAIIPDGEDPGSITEQQVADMETVDAVTWGIRNINRNLTEMDATGKQQAYELSVAFLKKVSAASVLYSEGQRQLGVLHDIATSTVIRDTKGGIQSVSNRDAATSHKPSTNPSMTGLKLKAHASKLGVPDEWFLSMGIDGQASSYDPNDLDAVLGFFISLTVTVLKKGTTLTFDEIRELSSIEIKPKDVEGFQYVLGLWNSHMNQIEPYEDLVF